MKMHGVFPFEKKGDFRTRSGVYWEYLDVLGSGKVEQIEKDAGAWSWELESVYFVLDDTLGEI